MDDNAGLATAILGSGSDNSSSLPVAARRLQLATAASDSSAVGLANVLTGPSDGSCLYNTKQVVYSAPASSPLLSSDAGGLGWTNAVADQADILASISYCAWGTAW